MKRFFTKLFIYILVIAVGSIIVNLMTPQLNADVAVQQLKDSNWTYLAYQAYVSYIDGVAFFVYIVLAIILFASDIKKLVKKIGGKHYE